VATGIYWAEIRGAQNANSALRLRPSTSLAENISLLPPKKPKAPPCEDVTKDLESKVGFSLSYNLITYKSPFLFRSHHSLAN
jgi:hypothetical protein